jgi:hypothetical protein
VLNRALRERTVSTRINKAGAGDDDPALVVAAISEVLSGYGASIIA